MLRKLVRWGIVVGLLAYFALLALGASASATSVALVPTMLLAVVEISCQLRDELKERR